MDRINEQLNPSADLSSCHKRWVNQLRLLLSSRAYNAVGDHSAEALGGTALQRAQC